MRRRRVAANEIVADGERMELGVVETVDGVVVALDRLCGEQESTEWLTGTIGIETDGEGKRRAYHKGKLIE